MKVATAGSLCAFSFLFIVGLRRLTFFIERGLYVMLNFSDIVPGITPELHERVIIYHKLLQSFRGRFGKPDFELQCFDVIGSISHFSKRCPFLPVVFILVYIISFCKISKHRIDFVFINPSPIHKNTRNFSRVLYVI